MNATSVITIGPSTSDEVNRFANSVIQAVENGEENPLKLLIQIRGMEKAFKLIAEKIKDSYMREADKYPENKFQFMGNGVEKGDVHTEYDYSICGDTVWEQRKTIFDMAKSQLDERQAFLKTLREPIVLVDEGSGEVVTVRPPLKKSTAGLKISIR